MGGLPIRSPIPNPPPNFPNRPHGRSNLSLYLTPSSNKLLSLWQPVPPQRERERRASNTAHINSPQAKAPSPNQHTYSQTQTQEDDSRPSIHLQPATRAKQRAVVPSWGEMSGNGVERRKGAGWGEKVLA